MSMFSSTSNAAQAFGFRNIFKTRDFLLHDGSALRRVRLSGGIQAAFAMIALALLTWSAFAAVQFASGVSAVQQDAAAIAAMKSKMVAMQADVAAMKRDATHLRTVAEERYGETASLIRELGLKPSRFTKGEAMGGPYEPAEASSADPQFHALFTSWAKLDQLEQGIVAIPSQKPVDNLVLTSTFGVRSDPFRGTSAMHSGVDIPGPVGTPIYAAADGVVGRSGWVGGYGNYIEINHGKGIETRYGHMSKLLVAANSRVTRGQLIGRMGSTGRSTGSHLHYEVRIDGRAVNPMPFLQSSDYLLAVQERAAGAAQVAVGGPADRTTKKRRGPGHRRVQACRWPSSFLFRLHEHHIPDGADRSRRGPRRRDRRAPGQAGDPAPRGGRRRMLGLPVPLRPRRRCRRR